MLYKYCANIVQILWKYNIILYRYSTNFVKIFSINVHILCKCFTNIVQILYKYCTNIVQILYKYYANISQILFKKRHISCTYSPGSRTAETVHNGPNQGVIRY